MPFIEGTMKGPDATFGLIRFYLLRLDIAEADKILFVADGGWIWNRIPQSVKGLGISPEQFYSLLNFYHAVEHLTEVDDLRKEEKAYERNNRIKRHRRSLLQGIVKEVISLVLSIVVAEKQKDFKR